MGLLVVKGRHGARLRIRPAAMNLLDRLLPTRPMAWGVTE
jgi:hypothetical protein